MVVGQAAVASVHLEDVSLATDASTVVDRTNVFNGTISLGLFNGPSVLYRVTVGDQLIEALLGGHNAFANGEQVEVVLPKRHIRILPRNEEASTADDDSVTA